MFMKRLVIILLFGVLMMPLASWAQDCKGCPASKSCSKAEMVVEKHTVYVVKGETIFHKKTCELLKEKDVEKLTKKEAIKKEYKPCTTCFPPVVKVKKGETKSE